jgi:hypothetical protein
MSSSPSSRSVSASGTDRRCTKCGSRVRPEQTWCSLCHTSVSAPSADESKWGSVAALVDELGDTLADEPPPPPFSAASTSAEDVTADRSTARAQAVLSADRLLIQLAAAEAGRSRESRLSALQEKLGTGGRSTAVLIAGIGGALLLAITVLGLTLLGLLL